jgi:DNA-binding LacI/PurR family transcriptional regulator
MVHPVPRSPLAEQTAEWLRLAILAGEWPDGLPGERILADHLNVSRPILRLALRRLEKAGIIANQPSHRRQVLGTSSQSQQTTTKVIFLVGADEALAPAADRHLLNAVTKRLWKAQRETEIRQHPSLETAAADRLLARWTSQEPPQTRWVLLSVSERVQRWFADHQIPALIVGSAHPGIAMPSFDLDHRAISRHAVGYFLRKGHRHIALISVDRPRAGNLESEAGFLEECQLPRPTSVESTILRTRREPDDLCRQLGKILRRPQPPTGFLVDHAQLALTTLTFLLSTGRRIPEDASLICREYEPFLSFVQPSLAHYRTSEETEARQLTRLIMADLKGAPSRRIFPRLIPGASLGPPQSFARKKIESQSACDSETKSP